MSLRRALPLLFAGLSALSVVFGTALDDKPQRPLATRGQYRIIEVDLHAHTRFSDGFLSPFDLVVQANRRGLDALSVTEHNLIFPGKMARWFSRVTGGPTILVGEEVTTKRFHLHGIGLTERVDASLPLDEVIRAIHRQGGVAIAAHPVKRYWESYAPVLRELDGAEVMHPIAFGSRDGGWRWEEMKAFYRDAESKGHTLTAIGSSDYHFMSPLGVCRTLVFTRGGDSEAEIVEALRARRTVVYDHRGEAYGDPALIALLEQEPYVMRPQDYGYRGNGPLDRVMRLFGLVGVLGLVVVGWRRALPEPPVKASHET